MRIPVGVVVVVFSTGCFSTKHYSVMLPVRNDACIDACRRVEELASSGETMRCYAKCGGYVSKGECPTEPPQDGSYCVEKNERKFALGRTFLLIAGIVLGAVAIGAFAGYAGR